MNFEIDANEKVLTYKTVDGKKIELLYVPPVNNVFEKAPVYFMISGGGWHYENKASMYRFSEISADKLRDNGWAVVSIDYRVVTQDMSVKDDISVVDIIEDCFDALQFIAINAQDLNIDVEKIVVSGHSAGAHLASMVSYADPKLFMGENFEPKFKIIGNAPISPITLLYLDGICKKPMEFDHNFVFSKKEYDDRVAHLCSPYDYITASSVPTLFVHGTHDDLVSCQNSVVAYEKGIEAGANFELITPVNGGHSLESMVKGKTTYPSVSFYQLSIASWAKELI